MTPARSSSRAPVPLSTSALPEIAAVIPVPRYDRTSLTAGIVHIGVGGFHRAHQAMYVDALMNMGLAKDWAIVGVGTMPQDRAMADALRSQDHLYTLAIKGPGGELSPRVIGSIVGYELTSDGPEAVIEDLASPTTRLVTLTITEGGYNVDPVTGQFDSTNRRVLEDAALGASSPSAFGVVVEALRRRRERRVLPFTVLSCDNIPSNGHLTRDAFVAFASLRDPELAAWIHGEVHFPSSMVDRITPVTSETDVAALEVGFGVQDRWPVVCEPFTQWVVEDDFGPCGRPPFEEVGAQFVRDVAPYELMKLRLLNASHQALCYLGYLAGYRYVHEAAGDPLFGRFLRAYMEREAIPTLHPVPGVDLANYVTSVIERFANPEIRDTLARICADTSDRIPKFLLPVLRAQLGSGGQVELAALVVASWARYARGVDDDGLPIDVVDPLRERLMTAARTDIGVASAAFLGVQEVFGDLADNERFRAAYVTALSSLDAVGARATLEKLRGEGII